MANRVFTFNLKSLEHCVDVFIYSFISLCCKVIGNNYSISDVLQSVIIGLTFADRLEYIRSQICSQYV